MQLTGSWGCHGVHCVQNEVADLDGCLECLKMEWRDVAAWLDATAADLRAGRSMTDRFPWSSFTAVIGVKVIVVVEPFDGIQVKVLPRV